MKLNKKIQSVLCLIIIAIISLSYCSCATETNQTDVDSNTVTDEPDSNISEPLALTMKYLTDIAYSKNKPADSLSSEMIENYANLSFLMLQNTGKTENLLISPLSITTAFAMLTNGAEKQSAEALKSIWGEDVTSEMINSFICTFTSKLYKSEDAYLNSANSLWVGTNRGFSVNPGFIDTVNEYYHADVIETDFSHPDVTKYINGWVNDKTEEMIPELLKKSDISHETIMVILNALAFNAKWENEFKKESTYEQYFNSSNKDKKLVEFMHSTENEKYICTDNATGIIKDYKGGKYAFVALLPKEGTSIDEYVKSLDGETFISLVKSATDSTVIFAMPKLSLDFDVDLSDMFKSLGAEIIFSADYADLSGLGQANGNLFVSKAIHKTHIDVDEAGTKAAAATAIIIDECTSAPSDDIKQLTLDRPFLYSIIDTQTSLPLFIGTFTSPD